MRLGSIYVTTALGCRCGAEVSGATLKRAYFWLTLHVWWRHGGVRLLRTLWKLLWWKPEVTP